MIDQARVDHVARVIMANLGGEEILTEEEWQTALSFPEEAEFIEGLRATARAAIEAADQFTGRRLQ